MIIGLENKYIYDEETAQGILVSSKPMNYEVNLDGVTEENLEAIGFANVVVTADSFFSTTDINGDPMPGESDVIEYFYTEE